MDDTAECESSSNSIQESISEIDDDLDKHTIVPRWPKVPRPLKRSKTSIFSSALDVVLAVVSIGFFAFSFAVFQADKEQVGQYEKSLLELGRLVSLVIVELVVGYF
jgi:hypothetical protein